MTYLRKILFRILILCVLLVSLLLFFRNAIGLWCGKALLEEGFEFSSSIAFLDIHLRRPFILAREIALLNNRSDFREPIAAKFNRIEFDYLPHTWLKGQPHLKRLRFEIENVTVVRTASGQINWNLSKSPSVNRSVRVDEFVISINSMTYIDEANDKSKTQKFALQNQVRIYKDLHSTREIRQLVSKFISEGFPKEIQNKFNE
jgi:hypothetical protein